MKEGRFLAGERRLKGRVLGLGVRDFSFLLSFMYEEPGKEKCWRRRQFCREEEIPWFADR